MRRYGERVEYRRSSSGSPLESWIGFSRAVRVGDRVIVSSTAPVDAEGVLDPDPAAQARRCLESIREALADLGAEMRNVVCTRIYLLDRRDAEAIGNVHREVFGAIRPASSFVVVSGFLDSRSKVELEVEAIVGGGARRLRRPSRSGRAGRP